MFPARYKIVALCQVTCCKDVEDPELALPDMNQAPGLVRGLVAQVVEAIGWASIPGKYPVLHADGKQEIVELLEGVALAWHPAGYLIQHDGGEIVAAVHRHIPHGAVRVILLVFRRDMEIVPGYHEGLEAAGYRQQFFCVDLDTK